jgi:hypothetical protein
MSNNKAKNTVALYVTNASISDIRLGKLEHGYNFVSKEVADEWIKVNNKIRVASPEEVAEAYGVK